MVGSQVMRREAQPCGLLCFRPKCLQRLANIVCYIVVFGVTRVLHGMSSGYSVTTTTTMEKRFRISSRTMGIVFSGKDISFVCLSLILAYHAGRGHRPLWLTFGTVLTALSAYMLALLHFLYGPGQQALALTEEYLDMRVLNASAPSKKETPLLCRENRTSSNQCEMKELASGEYSFVPLIFIFLSDFFLGIGIVLNNVLGETYIDDHTKKKNSPLMLGVVRSVRYLGPALGYIFSSVFLSLYVDPNLTPIINAKDPRWLGAWWLGWLVLGSLKLLAGTLMAFFPRIIPTKRKNLVPQEATSSSQFHEYLQEQETLTSHTENTVVTDAQQESKQDGFFRTLVRLLKNKILIYNACGGIFNAIVLSGILMFSLKYLEIQFQVSAAYISVIIGTVPSVAMVISLLGSGLLIGKLKIRTSLVLGWNVFVGLLEGLRFIIDIFLSCDINANQIAEISYYQTDFVSDCNSACGCDDVKYQPVCYLEKHVTFYSPCHIGCKDKYLDTNITEMFFTNCTCIPDFWSNTSLTTAGEPFVTDTLSYLDSDQRVIANGPCPVTCPSLYIYISLTFFIYLLKGFGRIGSTLVDFRCVDQKDKSFAQGINLLLVTLLGFIPGPIIFGAIIDYACLVWDTNCGLRGHCTMYDKDKFRLYYNITAAVLTTIGTCMDFKVWLLGKNLNLYDDDKNKPDKSGNQLKLIKRQSY